jgi:hypothetical protein
MSHPLDDARELVASAMEDINALERKIQEFLNNHPGRIEFDSTTNSNAVIGRLRLDSPIRPLEGRPEQRWGIAADEITGKMRSALDHAVYRLSEHDQDGGTHPDHSRVFTQFPIFTDNRNYFRGRKLRESYLAGLTEEHKKVIDGFQPFQHRTAAATGSDPLADLHSLDNRKKHRATNVGFLIRVGSFGEITIKAIDPPVLPGTFQLTLAPWRFEEGAVAVRIKLPTRAKQVEVQHHQGTIRFDVFFGDRQVSFQRLKEIHKYVYSIITRLSPLFD